MVKLKPYLADVTEVYFAGGEIIITPEHYECLDYWIESGQADTIELNYTTNFSTLHGYKNKDLIEYWKKFKNIQVWASLDAHGPLAECMRKGTDWERTIKNMKKLREDLPHVQFQITPTISIWNIFHFADFFDYMIDNGFIDLVAESHVEPEEFFITEKTIKSIALLKPFITLCSVGYHTDYLVNTYGLELYDELFDYSFDTMPNVTDRINGLVDNIERIVQIYNNDYRDQIHETLLPKMLRNRQHMIDYGLDKDKMVPASLKFLTDGTDFKLNGHVQKLTEYTLDYYKRMGWMS